MATAPDSLTTAPLAADLPPDLTPDLPPRDQGDGHEGLPTWWPLSGFTVVITRDGERRRMADDPDAVGIADADALEQELLGRGHPSAAPGPSGDHDETDDQSDDQTDDQTDDDDPSVDSLVDTDELEGPGSAPAEE